MYSFHLPVSAGDAKDKAAKAAKAVKKGAGKVKLLKKRYSPTFHRCVSDRLIARRVFAQPGARETAYLAANTLLP